ncbi:hypothetical protein NW762_004231 [Fusarium torreyae]|uniref:AB hydrolase-1 domain-containing protein n=1 Tax=Fusarium torreyae TaxID=1237075 RepID=A0A9W8S7E4_9HYPO|nr:hypothetical protein NW762_004231 [Fusarium torreyae]
MADPKEQSAQTFALPDGRTLAYSVYGSPTPSLHVFYFHSYPASRVEGVLFHDAALALGIQLICPDRPGMGSSSFSPDRCLLDWPQDILALADHLSIAQFGCVGVSGGGPYTIACYHKIPRSRLKAAAVLAGIWPTTLGTQGMPLESRVMLFLAPWVPGLVAAGLDYGIGKAARDTAHPEVYATAVDKSIESRAGVDRDVWRENKNGIKDVVLESMREALKDGSTGAAHDARVYGSDWGFALSDVKVEEKSLLIWHGHQDHNVPLVMAEKAVALLPGSQFRSFPDDGHTSLIAGKPKEFLKEVKTLLEG